jgi:2,3-bisphosphoglycerate-independent phosphoglycerate mutase
MPHVLLLFLDGVGIGKRNPDVNPFFAASLPALRELLGGLLPSLRDAHRSTRYASFTPINATLGVAGLPQSGTGQATLYTGLNAPKLIGRHFGPYPYSTLRPILAEKNVFRRIQSMGRRPFFVNAFPQRYFDYLASSNGRTSATTLAWLSTGLPLNDSRALEEGNAISADITGEGWQDMGYPEIIVSSPYVVGSRLSRIVRENDFTLFEYWLTDHAGHSQSAARAIAALERLDGLIGGVIEQFDYDSMLVIVTSDHGNIEDLSTKSHTRNPVPLLVVGKGHQSFSARVKSLKDVTPALIELFK